MTYEQIYTNIQNGVYEVEQSCPLMKKKPLDYVFDENKSVKWNKEQVHIWNKEVEKSYDEYNKKELNVQNLFKQHCISYICEEVKGTEKTNTFIYSKAWDLGHSAGYYSILQKIVNLCEFVSTIFMYESWKEIK